MLPALPTGIASASGAAPSSSHDLERGRLLALDPVRVDRVDELDRVPLGELADDLAAPGRSCRAGRSRARRASAPGRACRSRSCPRARSRRRAGRPAPRRRRRSPRCCRSTRRSSPRPRRPSARETATVIPRSLKLPVGFAPSSFRQHPSADALGDHRRLDQRRRALVERHHRVAGLERQPVAVALDQHRAAASRPQAKTPPRSPGSRAAAARRKSSSAISSSAA